MDEALFDLPATGPRGRLAKAAQTVVAYLQDNDALTERHALKVAILQELAEAAPQAKGIAKVQMLIALAVADDALPEILGGTDDDELHKLELERELAWFERHSPSADHQDPAHTGEMV